MRATTAAPLKVSDEVFLATALLHREHPDREDFTIEEIVNRAAQENLHGSLRPGLRVHATAHCVANRPPQPATLRMLYATGRSTRRLYRPGDPVAVGRENGRTMPERSNVPQEYHSLLDWYEHDYCRSRNEQDGWLSGVKQMFGMFKGVWADEHPDDYVRRLREGWE